MEYSDNENDYNSDTHYDAINDDNEFHDVIINDLKKLSNKNNIKAIRQYISIHENKLNGYKTRLLNEIVNISGYKFLRRNGKLTFAKICPSEYMYKNKLERNYKTDSEYGDCGKKQINHFGSTISCEDFDDKSYKDDYENVQRNKIPYHNDGNSFQETFQEGFHDDNSYEKQNYKPPERNIQMNSPYKNQQQNPSEIINKEKDSITNEDLIPYVNTVKKESNQMNSLGLNINQMDNVSNGNELNYATKTIINEEPSKINYNEMNPLQNENQTKLANILNSIYKQANEQNESQKSQYEKLANTLKDSIQAKTNIEQEQINKFNKCVATIEKTFSAGTFDKIVEHINNMVISFTTSLENKNNEIKSRFEDVDSDVRDLLYRTDEQQKVINELINKKEDNEAFHETINDMEITIDELRDKIQEQDNTIKQLQTNVNSIIKQHAELINKLLLVVYNIDESIYNQILICL